MSPAHLEIQVLGPHCLLYKQQEVKGLRTRKAWGLLFYLLVISIEYPGRKISRDKLAALFWPEANEKAAKDNLRQALYQIRKAIPQIKNSGLGEKSPLIDENTHGLGLHPKAEMQCDLIFLKKDILSNTSGQIPPTSFEVYKGDFLMDFLLPDCPSFEEWRDNYRTSLRNQYLRQLARQIEDQYQENNLESCLRYLQCYLRQECAQEFPYEIWMKILLAQGQGLEAIRIYEKAADIFQRELALSPGTALRSLRKKAEKSLLTREKPDDFPSHIPRIGLLPFHLISPHASDDYLKEGFLTELITYIAQIPGLQLIHQNSIQQFLKSGNPVKEIQGMLQLDYLLEGTLQIQGKRLKITLHWVKLKQQEYFWTGSFEGQLQELFDLQLNIAQEAARQIKSQLGLASSPTPTPTPIPQIPFEAYDAFLKGRYSYYKAHPDALKQALAYYQTAVQLAPHFCQAHLEIACVLGSEISWWGDQRLEDVSEYFYESMQKVQASPNYEAYKGHTLAILAWFKLWEYQLPQAQYFFQKSVTENPPGPWAFPGLAHTYNLLGRHELALENARKGLELDPLLVQNYIVMAEALLLQGKYPAARQKAEYGLGLDADYAPGIATLAWIFIKEAAYEEAIELCQKSIAKSPSPPFFILGRLGQAHAERGD
ncbi:MAG: BTAD domain-containing putative transcriptional regulator, partial [Bacteroidota bacterium]